MIRDKKANSRLEFLFDSNLVNSKRSQITIFIIIALVIVAALIILFYPRIKTLISPSDISEEIKACAEEATNEALGKIEVQGGFLEPENYMMYQGNKIEYACYTNEYFKTCIMQRPFLKQDIEEELIAYVEPEVKGCISRLKSRIEKKSGTFSMSEVDVEVSIIPNSIVVVVNAPIVVTEEGTSRFDEIKVSIKSQIYKLSMIASSISNYEARYGAADTLSYMLYYPDIKVEKKEQDAGTVYILTHKPTGEKFMFASRSLVWPSGYTGR